MHGFKMCRGYVSLQNSTKGAEISGCFVFFGNLDKPGQHPDSIVKAKGTALVGAIPVILLRKVPKALDLFAGVQYTSHAVSHK